MDKQPFFVGTYSPGGENCGIYSCSLDIKTGEMVLEACLKGVVNPSYLAVSKTGNHLFSVRESGKEEHPAVASFRIQQDFTLSHISSQAVSGSGPCHLSLNETEQLLAVANYNSGNVLLYPVQADGQLEPFSDNVQHIGRGLNPARQEGPHAHQAVFHEGKLFVTDLGLDEIKVYQVQEHKLEPLSSFQLPPGAGPRHLIFYPTGRFVFVINELDSSLSLLNYEAGKLHFLDTWSTLPQDFQGESYCAAIHLNPAGDVIYASNRGHDSIAVFAFNKEKVSLKLIQHVSTGGKFPRDFALTPDGHLLVVANQHTDDLFSFRIDQVTGKLEPTGYSLTISKPVCVLML